MVFKQPPPPLPTFVTVYARDLNLLPLHSAMVSPTFTTWRRGEGEKVFQNLEQGLHLRPFLHIFQPDDQFLEGCLLPLLLLLLLPSTAAAAFPPLLEAHGRAFAHRHLPRPTSILPSPSAPSAAFLSRSPSGCQERLVGVGESAVLSDAHRWRWHFHSAGRRRGRGQSVPGLEGFASRRCERLKSPPLDRLFPGKENHDGPSGTEGQDPRESV